MENEFFLEGNLKYYNYNWFKGIIRSLPYNILDEKRNLVKLIIGKEKGLRTVYDIILKKDHFSVIGAKGFGNWIYDESKKKFFGKTGEPNKPCYTFRIIKKI